MAYIINLTDGTLLTTIADGTYNDTSSSITLVGKNYTGYGQFINTDLVHMLENFKNDTAPSTPLVGQLWYDSAGILKVYDGSDWKDLGTISKSPTAPASPLIGQQWWDTTNLQFKVYNGTGWSLIGPSYSQSQGVSGIVVESIVDTGSTTHTAVSVYSNNERVAIFSDDAAYTPNVAVTGFSTINPGMNLSTNISGSQIWGTTENSNKLGNIAANAYAQLSGAAFTGNLQTSANLLVGNTVINQIDSDVTIRNSSNNGNIILQANVAGTNSNVVVIQGTNATVQTSNILPLSNNTYDIGSAGDKFANVYFSNLFTNTATIQGNLTVNGTITASSSAMGVPSGGTGLQTITANAVMLGNGISSVKTVSPGTLGNILTSTGDNWVSQAAPASSTFSGGSTGLTPSSPTTGNIVLAGNLNSNSGGTGRSSLTANALIVGNGTDPVQFITPGANGSALVSDGTNWIAGSPSSPTVLFQNTYTVNTVHSIPVTTPNKLIQLNINLHGAVEGGLNNWQVYFQWGLGGLTNTKNVVGPGLVNYVIECDASITVYLMPTSTTTLQFYVYVYNGSGSVYASAIQF